MLYGNITDVIVKFIYDVIYWGIGCDVTKKMARDYANFGKAVNERFGIKWLEEDWHQIYNYFWELK